MSQVIVGMTMSLDGFVQDRNGSVKQLYADMAAWSTTELLQESIRNTGAVIMGRRAYSMAEDPDWYVGNYEYQVPIFVVTHHPPENPPKQDDRLTFTYVTDGVASAVRQAKAAAGDKDVTVIGGASVIQQIINAGLADVLNIDVMPVLLGTGLRLFDNLDTNTLTLEKVRVVEAGARTSLTFRITKSGDDREEA